MIYVPFHITSSLERLAAGAPFAWAVSRSGSSWVAYAEWRDANSRVVVGGESMDGAMQALLGRLLEVEDDLAATEVWRAPLASSGVLPALRPGLLERIKALVAHATGTLSHRP